jgi:hypothetical protein
VDALWDLGDGLPLESLLLAGGPGLGSCGPPHHHTPLEAVGIHGGAASRPFPTGPGTLSRPRQGAAREPRLRSDALVVERSSCAELKHGAQLGGHSDRSPNLWRRQPGAATPADLSVLTTSAEETMTAGADALFLVARSRHAPPPLDWKPQNSNDPVPPNHMINL